MIISAHLLAGGVIGEAVNNPLAAFLLAIISHFILDSIPHFDNFLDKKCRWTWKQTVFTSLDILLFLSFVYYFRILPDLKLSFWWGAFGGILPDLIDNVPVIQNYTLKLSVVRSYHRFHEKLHFIRPGILIGLLTQAIAITLFVAAYLFMVK